MPAKRNASAQLGFEAKLWLAADKRRGHVDAAVPSGAEIASGIARLGGARQQAGNDRASHGESIRVQAATRHEKRNEISRHLWRIPLHKRLKSAYLASYEDHSATDR